ncbi:MAG TPA: SxtJ family membrane protein [Thermoanaerobaculia bacterium]
MSSSWIETAAPARKQLITFGVTIAAALAVIAGVRAWRNGMDEVAISAFIVAGLFAASAVIAPDSLASVYRWWMRIAEALGWINTRILLIVIFYLVVTPVGLIMRMVRRSPLDVAEKDSYWTASPRNSYGDRHYEKQF